MTRNTKMWIVRSLFLAGAVWIYFFIRKEQALSAKYTREPLHEDSLKFNSAEWKKDREYYEEIRPYMQKDLMANVLVIGMDSTTVKDLLGETWGPHSRNLWDYKLGVYREIESSYLEIGFDSIGKLKHVNIVDR
jgi:hypothetical protein